MYRPAQQTITVPGQPPTTSARMALFSQRNRDMLNNLLVQEFNARIGHVLGEKQMVRLERTLNHYVEAIYTSQGDKPLSILNKEILRITGNDFNSYLDRQDAIRAAPTAPVQTVVNDTLFQDTSTRYENIQQERQGVKALPPPAPDFRIPLGDEGPTSIDLFERAKKTREQEALKQASTGIKDAMERMDPGIQKRFAADDIFRNSQLTANKASEFALVERTMNIRPMDLPLIVPPDRRDLMFSTNITIDPSGSPRDLGQANSNPTTTYPQLQSSQKLNLQQDNIIREENVISWKETEYNVFLYSVDRNWLNNTRENRYNFSVVFDPGNNGNVLPPTQQVQRKFKNITRIELVKAILPIEGLTTLIKQDPIKGNDTSYQLNVLSFPYVTVVIDELDSNNWGTDNMIDKSFGVIQYDANWLSDPFSGADSRGYTAFIPKFMKCQKVYTPTPLSTLQKLSISLVQPNGNLISTSQDALDIDTIFGAGAPLTAGSVFDIVVGGQPKYFFIFTSAFFSRFQFTMGDIIRVGNFNYLPEVTNTIPALNEFATWINNTSGYVVAGIGYRDPTGGAFVDGANAVGYANCIIIDARYFDPISGSTELAPFGLNINNDLSANAPYLLIPRRIINLSRQVQLVFRIITRELDPLGQIRADNM